MEDDYEENETEAKETSQPVLKLDKKAEQGFISFFKGLPKSDSVRFFDRKAYYSVHGDDAILIGQEYYKTRDAVKVLGNPPQTLASLCISTAMFETIARDLLLSKLRHIELWIARAGSSGWILDKKGSPGNIQGFEDTLFHSVEMVETPMTAGISIAENPEGYNVGISIIDQTRRMIFVAQFQDNNQFSHTESSLVQTSAKECLMCKDEKIPENLTTIVSLCDITTTMRTKLEASPKDIEQDLSRLTGCNPNTIGELSLRNAMIATAMIIKYLDLTGDSSSFGKYKVCALETGKYMKLGGAAIKALNFFASKDEGKKKTTSMYGLLNRCKSAMGSRLLLQWMKQPLLSTVDIGQRHDIVETFVSDVHLRLTMQNDFLARIPDVPRINRKFQRRTANLQDVVKLYQLSSKLVGVSDLIGTHEGPHPDVMNQLFAVPLKKAAEELSNFEGLVESTIDLSSIEQHEYLINPSFNEELAELRTRMDKLNKEIEKISSKAASDLGLDGRLKLERNNQIGYFFRITRKDESVIRNSSEYRIVEIRKDGVRFANSKLKQMSAQYDELNHEYNAKQTEIVDKVIEVVSTYFPIFETIGNCLAQLDVLISFADVAASAPTPYTRPTLHEPGEYGLELIAARHPCVELQDGVSFIPNTIQMRRGDSDFLIITGPNMGGKSTYIRQIGVIVWLAQIGSFIPCDSGSKLDVVDCILARVGAGDSQLKGLSTFMAEMLETSSILKAATRNSLIIIDELGRGTSTYDGFGLAWSISEHIAKEVNSLCLFATHFHELTTLAEHYSNVKNLHVTAHTDEKRIEMLYQVNPGPCEKSFGIHVAQLANFPKAVIECAKRKAQELEDFSYKVDEDEQQKKQKLANSKARAEMIQAFLQQFAALPIDQMSPEDAVESVRRLHLTLGLEPPMDAPQIDPK
eukprot:TRINITY_DN12067_c0_g1_i1.p1 TRINITY_DN12067_c0_g1~~TRINITY_DN12067_c0_g1_i1.p1  ORF type:complete len:919 (+),score=178.55 TRINITY_DN12067_c0_g1_i1:68-2824(+)